ncbi:MAG TPA: hypothetical protein VHE55_12385 [Fimbriimonadaceae bacterium]|nr:hypothetical protein [Fimbriimonadaceae bacterium]
MFLSLLLAWQIQAAPRLHLSTSEFASQYGTLRAMEEAREVPAEEGMKAAVEELAKLEQSFPNQIRMRSGEVVGPNSDRVKELYWRTIDALTFSAGSPDDLDHVAELLPKIGGELDTGAATAAVQKALALSKEDFEAKVWPKERQTAQECVESFATISTDKQEAAIRFVAEAAGIAKTPKEIDILVVPRMAGKEGMTVRTRSGTLIVIGAGKYRGADFDEVVFHEATHVLDTAAGLDSLFGKLRSALKAANRTPFEIEQVPHVAMFLLAAEATRRFIDPKHKDVGDTFGTYTRGLQPLRVVVEPVLKKLIAHEIDMDEAVRTIVSGLGRGS